MTAALIVRRIGPGASVQDAGRPGYLAEGLSRSGAADARALAEGAALLSQPPTLAVLEMAGMGGVFEATAPMRIALTGAPMSARIGDTRAAWNASHALQQCDRLTIGGTESGVYGYLHLGGGLDTPERLGSRAAHLAAGLGRAVAAGDKLPAGPDPGGTTGLHLPTDDRFNGGTVAILPGPQTQLFSEETVKRFEATTFHRDARANRMGVRLQCPEEGFFAEGQLNILSETIVPGDIQITGDGTPFVLMPECQTTGGYPRIGTVLPCDLPRLAQAPAEAMLQFRFIDRDTALARHRAWVADLAALPGKTRPLVRDPRQIPDLLSYRLIDGMISATDET